MKIIKIVSSENSNNEITNMILGAYAMVVNDTGSSYWLKLIDRHLKDRMYDSWAGHPITPPKHNGIEADFAYEKKHCQDSVKEKLDELLKND